MTTKKNKSEFFKAYRKKGFEETLDLLGKIESHCIKESKFFEKFAKTPNMYMNEFYRSKDDLLKNNFISYSLDEKHNRIINLTEKGIQLKKAIDEINKSLE
ncbi:MAG: hypothetical protein GF364_17970 [Candidatus Lokiarchaeota archaeon]|nr:hypothetical protein [Candidatus Lokiarchaeota archaeon]